jgi:hypothetical protein
MRKGNEPLTFRYLVAILSKSTSRRLRLIWYPLLWDPVITSSAREIKRDGATHQS